MTAPEPEVRREYSTVSAATGIRHMIEPGDDRYRRRNRHAGPPSEYRVVIDGVPGPWLPA